MRRLALGIVVAFAAADVLAGVRTLPGGALRLADGGGCFRAGLYTPEWQFASAAPTADGYVMRPDGSWPFVIRRPSGDLNGTGVFSRFPDGRIRATWRVTPTADGPSRGLVVAATVPARDWCGGVVTADGRRVELPKQPAKAGLLGGTFRTLTFADASGKERFSLAFDGPQSLLLQDDRAIAPAYSTLTLRLFLASGAYRKGTTYELNAWFSGAAASAFDELRPVTVREGDGWIRVVSCPDILPGSALDFSAAIPCRHAPAGRYGRVVAVGDHFEFERRPGVAQRFAGANVCGPSVAVGEGEAALLAKRFSALGYNSVRIHNHDWVFCRGQADGTALDEPSMRAFDALFAAFKAEGHYVTIDLFVNRKIPWRACGVARDGVLSMNDFKAWVQFHEGVCSNFLAHADAFLTRVNVKTGVRYADDPALAFVSLVNEANLGNQGRAIVSGCPEGAAAYAAYVAAHGGADTSATLEAFFAERERLFARRITRHLREDLKCRALLTNMNAWHYTDAIDRVRREELDYADQHHYVAHPTYLGKLYSPPTAGDMTDPLVSGAAFGLVSRKLAGRPFACSEWNFCAPLPTRSQAGLATGLMAAVGGWGALWRYAWSDNPAPVVAPAAAPLQYFMIGADPLALATERATTCLFLRRDGDALADALRRARETHRLTVDAAATSGGWAQEGMLEAGFLTARLSAPAAVWVSSLDGKPLAESRRMTLFHLTEVLNAGTAFSDAAYTVLTNPGRLPLLARAGEAEVALPLAGDWRLYALATDGRRTAELPLRSVGERRAFTAKVDGVPGEATLAYELIRTN